MDRNSIIGLILIAGILIGYSIWIQPSPEDIAKMQRTKDSIAALQVTQQIALKTPEQSILPNINDTLLSADSLEDIKLKEQFGAFAPAAKGEEKQHIVENDLLKLTISSKGGRVVSAEVKNYKTNDSLPLILFHENQTEFNINLVSGGKNISTGDLFFQADKENLIVKNLDSNRIVFRSYVSEKQYIEYSYGLKGNSYQLDYDVRFVGLNDLIAKNEAAFNLHWFVNTPNIEKSVENQRANSTVYYKPVDEEADYIGETKDDKEVFEKDIEWVGFKQQFFSTILVADKSFLKTNSDVETKADTGNSNIKQMTANLSIPFNHNAVETFGMSMYFGPNAYEILESHGRDLHKIIPLGWGIFGWVNRFMILPIFNFLDNFNMNYGIIILLMTIMIKMLLLPLTYKAYLSTAKMKVLKPEIDELNAKHAKEDPLKKQQALMALYKKAGVSPFGGCIPMLLQFPILIAMFRFFPAAIELRQQAFLWADDLSSYDSVYDLSFNIPFYGDHVSMFTLLMTVSTILYTRSNSQMTASPEMAQMKWMMYLMPIIFLGVFNNYSAGLSYYYFLANMITFGQQYLFQKFVDNDALHAKIEAHKKKPSSNKKSSFQQRLEEMAKKKGYNLPNKN